MFRSLFILSLIFLIGTNIAKAESLTIIGDSITLKAKPYFEQISPTTFSVIIDAKKGRKFQDLFERINFLELNSLLKNVVIIALGTNGPFTLYEALNITDYLLNLGKKVFFVNVKVPRVWEDEVNFVLKELKKLRQEIYIIEWNPEYKKLCSNVTCFKKDGYHLTDEGALIYANFIINFIQNQTLSFQNN